MHLLLIEDSVRLQDSLSAGLRREGYAVDVAGDGLTGLRQARANRYDAIILDLMLPGLDGLGVLAKLREASDPTHVLVLTARGSVEDRVNGLKLGADDYLPKPFAFDELLARVGALVRRGYQSKSPTIRVGALTIDTASHAVAVDQTPIPLTRREYMLVEYLAYRRGQVVDRRQIEDHLYGEADFPTSNAVDRLVCAVRKKLDSAGAGALLSTRRGVGYRLGERAA